MFGFIVRRSIWAVVLVIAITIVTYDLFFLIPTQPGAVGPRRAQNTSSVRESLDISGPVYKEYGIFLWRLGHGSFGRSWATDRNVNEVILEAAPVTLSLVLGGAIFWLFMAIPVGILSALRPRSMLDRLATVFVLIGISAHPVWLGLILSYTLGFKAHVFPIQGYCDLTGSAYGCNGFMQWFQHLVLPWLTFALLYAALYARMIRACVLETIGEDYVRTARAKGATSWRILRVHVLRNAMLPVVTMLGVDLGVWISNAVFVETVYGLPGVGKLLTAALSRRDLPVVMAIVVFVSVLIVVLNMIVDVIYAAIDPRVRASTHSSGGAGRKDRARMPAPVGPIVSSSEQPA
ncbi:MAG TPA: ABC transporter permease [Gaiellaceae bacterium]|nr:ABC transporter permease [Gaiellaceae bacterium]